VPAVTMTARATTVRAMMRPLGQCRRGADHYQYRHTRKSYKRASHDKAPFAWLQSRSVLAVSRLPMSSSPSKQEGTHALCQCEEFKRKSALVGIFGMPTLDSIRAQCFRNDDEVWRE
jgi:hypothetical protein